ncbi:hypothetical protein BFW01_g10105 [Lasiodiplodia theobromae]|nr:hypothetical protein BFW01_g10105 [Lasiodiplodia theobromae]
MPYERLRDYLEAPFQVLDNRVDDPSAASEKQMRKWPNVPGVTEWKITRAYIETTIGYALNAFFHFPDNNGELSVTERIVYDERSFEHFCGMAEPCARVNTALRTVGKMLAHVPEFPKLCLASGSFGKNDNDMGKPDWAVVPSMTGPRSKHTCRAPGDTKATPEKFSLPINQTDNEWAWKYTRQVCHYMNERKSRYAWIITPEELVIFRRRKSDTTGEITPEYKAFSWIPEEGQVVSAATALFFVIFLSGLNNKVLPKYQTPATEHKEKIAKIKEAVKKLSIEEEAEES